MYVIKNLHEILCAIQKEWGIGKICSNYYTYRLTDEIEEKSLYEVNEKEIVHRMLLSGIAGISVFESCNFCFFIKDGKFINMTDFLGQSSWKIHPRQILDSAELNMDNVERILEGIKQSLKKEINELTPKIEEIKKRLGKVDAVICFIGESKRMKTIVYYH